MPAHISRIKPHAASNFIVPQETRLAFVNNWIIVRFKLLACKIKFESKFSRTLKAIIKYDRQAANTVSRYEKLTLITTKSYLQNIGPIPFFGHCHRFAVVHSLRKYTKTFLLWSNDNPGNSKQHKSNEYYDFPTFQTTSWTRSVVEIN